MNIKQAIAITKGSEPNPLVPKYRLGKKNKRAILYTETGREYLIFPQSKTEHVKEFLDFLNGKEAKEETNKAELWDDVQAIIEGNADTEIALNVLKSKFTLKRK